MALADGEVLQQSKAAFAQWGEQWKIHAKRNGAIPAERRRTLRSFSGCGVGRQIILCAMGPSLEKAVPLMQEADCEIACVDKAFGPLVARGLADKIRFVFLADANVSFDWARDGIEHSANVVLFANVCANPEWIENWRGPIVLTVNRDNIQSERIFSELSGVTELVPAASNVGNTMTVIAALTFGYDRYLMTGMDYCWRPDGNYYAFHQSDKRYWQKRIVMIDPRGDSFLYGSPNMRFSAQWLEDFIKRVIPKTNGANVIDCSGGMLGVRQGDLSRLISYEPRAISPDEARSVFEASCNQVSMSFDTAQQAIDAINSASADARFKLTIMEAVA